MGFLIIGTDHLKPLAPKVCRGTVAPQSMSSALRLFDEMCRDYDLLAAALELERERGDRLQARLDELEPT